MDLKKTYFGIVKNVVEKGDQKFGFIFCPALQRQNYELELFFHFSRVNQNNSEIRTGTILQFDLLYSQKHPGKLAAKNINVLPYTKLVNNVIGLGVISNEDIYNKLKELINGVRGVTDPENLIIAKEVAYENANTEYRLKLWVDILTDKFDFEEFKKFTFLLNATELKKFKAYAKKDFVIKKSDAIFLNPSKLIEIKPSGSKILETSWSDIGFLDNHIVFKDEFGNYFKEYLAGVKGSFNLLIPYLQKKNFCKIHFEILNSKVINSEGLDQLKEAILVIQKKRLKKKYEDLIKRGYNPSEDSEFRELSNKEFLEIMGKQGYIEYLQEFQSTKFDMRIIYYDESYLFSIPLSKEQIAIVWESLDVNKATYIFKCNEFQYRDTFNLIETYLKDETVINKRAKLIGRGYDSAEIQNDFKFLKSIKHVDYNFEKWEKNLLTVLPELASLKKGNPSSIKTRQRVIVPGMG